MLLPAPPHPPTPPSTVPLSQRGSPAAALAGTVDLGRHGHKSRTPRWLSDPWDLLSSDDASPKPPATKVSTLTVAASAELGIALKKAELVVAKSRHAAAWAAPERPAKMIDLSGEV